MIDLEKIINESFDSFINTFVIPVITNKLFLSTVAVFIAGIIVSFVIKKLFYNYFIITGDSKRKAKKKSNLIDDVISLIDFFRNKS